MVFFFKKNKHNKKNTKFMIVNHEHMLILLCMHKK